MAEELMNFDLPVNKSSIIKVIGVGGGGSNAVNHMYLSGIKDVDFVVCNTDAQALLNSPVSVKIQLGETLTEGLGAGNQPNVGREAAIENLEDVFDVMKTNTKMAFITAGMGGGTGTGAAPIIAKAAKEMGVLTIGIVTIPFKNEGKKRINQALEGIEEMQKHVDSLLVINNEKLREIYGNFPISEAFARADDVLATAAKGIAEIITVHGYINVDFADVKTVMRDSGVAIMGTGTAEGEDRAIKAVDLALTSPLLNNNDISGARNILINVTSGAEEITMDEIGEITDYVQDAAGFDADLIWGNGIDESLGNNLKVTVIATGFGMHNIPELYAKKKKEGEKVPLDISRVSEPSYSVSQHQDKVQLKGMQQTIDFEVKTRPVQKEVNLFSVDENEGSAVCRNEGDQVSRKIKEYITDKKKSVDDMHSMKNQDDIDYIESVPAFRRKKFKLEELDSKANEVSKFSLKDDAEGTRLSDDNPYLHDAVD